MILTLTYRSAAHESATRTARLRVELSQSHSEQKEYLKNVELAHVLAKREEKKRARASVEREDRDASLGASDPKTERIVATVKSEIRGKKRRKRERWADAEDAGVIDNVLLEVF
jgi:ESF2/ABP1 family protein